MSNQLALEPIALAQLNRVLGGVYKQICGSERGFENSRNRFVDHFGIAHISPLLDEIASDFTSNASQRLSADYRSFLNHGQRCAKGTPGRLRYLNSVTPKGVDSQLTNHISDHGLHITTPRSYIIVLGSQPVNAPKGQIPTLGPISWRVHTGEDWLPFVKSASVHGTEVTRLNDYSIRIFVGDDYLGDVSTIDFFENQVRGIEFAPRYLAAWNAYLNAFLQKVGIVITRIEALLSKEKNEHINIKELIDARDNLMGFYEGTNAFLDHPLLVGTWEYHFVKTQISKLDNIMAISHALDDDTLNGNDREAREGWLYNARRALSNVFEPFDHIQKSYAIEPLVKDWVEVQLPEKLPEELWNGNVIDGIALRNVIDRIIYTAGRSAEQKQTQAKLYIMWDPELEKLVVTDISSGMKALQPLKAPAWNPGPLDQLLFQLGDELRIKYTPELKIKYSIGKRSRLDVIEIFVPSNLERRQDKAIANRKAEGKETTSFADVGGFDPNTHDIRAYFEQANADDWSHMNTEEQGQAIAIIDAYAKEQALHPGQISAGIYCGVMITTISRAPVAPLFILPLAMAK